MRMRALCVPAALPQRRRRRRGAAHNGLHSTLHPPTICLDLPQRHQSISIGLTHSHVELINRRPMVARRRSMWGPRILLLALGLRLLLLPVITAMASSGGAAAIAAAARGGSKPAPPVAAVSSPPSVLVLDVDGTLYDASTGLESEIAARIKRYCNEAFGTTEEECDDLHRRYGSTIEGLRQLRKLKAPDLAAFYDNVYRGLPLHRLLPRPPTAVTTATGEEGDVLGYAHRMPLRELLSAHAGPVWVASNSPSFHVHAVLRVLGLTSFPFAGVLTPDSGRKGGGVPYPTKTDPRFWEPFLKQFRDAGGIVLLDDSDANLAAAAQLGMQGVKVNGRDGLPLDRALAASLGAIDTVPFDDVAYIRAKNAVDARSFCAPTARRLGKELAALREAEGDEPTLRVRDLGAGLLSMLEPVLRMAGHAGWASVEYEAFEVNPTLVAETRAAMVAQGFKEEEEEGVLVREGQEDGGEEEGSPVPAVRVRLRPLDFGGSVQEQDGSAPHLLVGCCLADLYQPDEFVARLLRVAGSAKAPQLVYLPITFAGRTCLCPPAPEEEAAEGRRLPADGAAMAAYHASLEETQGHNLDPSALISALERHGASLLAQGPADWIVKREKDPVLWDCLVHFFGLGLLPRLGPEGWDIPAWRRRLLQRGPDIEVGNVDLLFRLAAAGEAVEGAAEGAGDEKKGKAEGKANVYVEFVGPRDVRCKEEAWPPKGKERALGPTELEVEAVCSLISSGTELKVYRGDFDRESAVDVSIKGMASERMDYPLRYGYSMVGRVVRCGAGIADPGAYLGPNRLVFCFAPHASKAIVDASAAMPVPLGIAPEDAVYLPSIETALSLVQDACPVAGERVTVVGAGLIGLLVVSVLSQLHLSTLRAVDPLPTRCALARLMGASEATDPGALAKGGEEQKADTSIEVSGVAAGLQTALDFTGYGGRVIVGSWYGNHEKPATLRLGLPFHRSHLRVQCSQVSRISTKLQDRWTKARRFGVAWDLVRRLRPSRTLTTLVVPPQRVAEAFEALDQRAVETLAVLIDYRPSKSGASGAGR